ncbi:dihydrolipoyl dehydrogenase [Phocea massiliensis]|uniref:Dihydrolipoyl dehydrogenase n=1 Tax=uncultured Anaerotruncus sp. TaxID=905011 RepID=A0A6N2TXS8_9FIRM|nr:dihydrolipoyl dehydrogenase [Merdimmobilis hominis]MCD4835495.1 dihydrolipoyl dehydrogenase [Merdimmobilis hominis]
MNEYQLIVIGAGPGGYEAAIRAAQLGLTTALVENRQVGGTCLNRGCIPTKALLHAAALYRGVQEFESVGLCAQGVSFDIQKVHDRKNQVIEQLRSGIEQLIKANKIDLYQGTGTLTGPHSVTVATGEGPVELAGENILVATGSKPSRPPIPGLDLPHVGTSDEFLFLEDKLYENLIIIGGGVIGVEFASVYQSFGCKVTIVEAMDRILPPMDREISQNLAMILKKRGVAIHTGAMVERLEETPEGIACHFTQKGKEQVVTADGVLVAIGRRPNTDGLFAEGFSVEMERGRIVTDEAFRTNVPSIRAIGDVTAKIQLAHMASAQGLTAVELIAGKEPSICLTAVPGCVYTDPEIATVGLTEEECKEKGIAVHKGKYIMSGNGKSIIEQADRGFIKLLFDEKTDVLLGAHLMCCRATDLISELSTAIVNKLTSKELSSVIRPHPTFTEAVTEAVESAHGMAIHLAPAKK